jgi:very-short-patch-repair endonuclease
MQNIGRYTNKSCFIERRKKLRKKATYAEKILWKQLKAKQFGIKFRRQYNIGYYIVDFYCHERKLIIELDGSIHGEKEQMLKDMQRQKYLENKKYTVVRYTNEQIKYDLEGVLQDIWNKIHTSLY